jgi:AraC family transcriptional regulator of adaptative response / DNA-3-methyladenine glycosylase II
MYGCGRIERALERLGIAPTTKTVTLLADHWRPWRSYAVAQLWRSIDDEDEKR